MGAALKAAERLWEQEKIQAANDNLPASIDAEGKVPIVYDPAELPAILTQVEEAVFADERNDLVLTHTQGLVTVCEKRPTTVREVIRENGAEDVKSEYVCETTRERWQMIQLHRSRAALSDSSRPVRVAAATPAPSQGTA